MPVKNVIRSLLLLVPATVLAAGCVASTEGHDSEGEAFSVVPPPVTPPGKQLPSPPSAPQAFGLTPYATMVDVGWSSPDSTMTQFIVYRRDARGTWQAVHTEANRAGQRFSWVDTDHSLSAQCYLVAAQDAGTGYSSSTKEQCTIRPDASVFPQSSPSAAVEWFGLASTNDGVGPLDVGNQFLQTQSQTWGVSLGWGHNTGDNVKVERQGVGSTWPVMRGEAIAIRVWGAGWLKYGNQTWGVDLTLSDTPSYEWYVVGEGTPGLPLNAGAFALWNRAAGDYLVKGDQTWGIGLNWYQKTLPPPPPPPPPPTQGVKTLTIYNCISEQRSLEMWVDDVTAGTGWSDSGSLAQQYTSGGCPTTGSPWRFTPTSGHQYIVRAIDTTVPGCSSYDTSSCTRLQMVFVGDANGQSVVQTAG